MSCDEESEGTMNNQRMIMTCGQYSILDCSLGLVFVLFFGHGWVYFIMIITLFVEDPNRALCAYFGKSERHHSST